MEVSYLYSVAKTLTVMGKHISLSGDFFETLRSFMGEEV